MLIDEFLPTYTVAERHAIVVTAPVSAVYAAIRSAELAQASPVRLLLALRAAPGALLAGRRGLGQLYASARARITLRDFERRGFAILAEDPPREILIGLVGAFWRPRGGLRRTDALHFRAPQEPLTVRAAWNFAVEEQDRGRVVLSTETRLQPADRGSAWRFRLYWLVVRPWSGLTRRYMLRAIRAEAERAAAEQQPHLQT